MQKTYSLELNDACWFLNQAKGLPDIPKTKQLLSRYLRATVVFSWVALEQMLGYAIDEYVANGKLIRASVPSRLRDRIEQVFAVSGNQLDRPLFKKHRDLRNDITHSDGILSISDVQAAYDFCIDTIGAFYPRKVSVTYEDVTYP
ncbi:MAG: hypothetical protein QOK48_185 [Blastocatellia bacterium]|nr:hypothetical protein [Blastocatellia bacterium]